MHKSQGGERRERKDMLRNLERVLRAAQELFARRGAAVTMEEVARHAGVGVGTIYRRFPSKEHLFMAVSQAACAHTHQCLREAAEGEHDPVAKLHAVVLMHYRRLEEQATLLDLRAEPDQRSYSSGAEQHFYATLHGMLQQVIVEGQHANVFGHGDPAVLAAVCLELLSPHAFQNLQRVLGGAAEDVAVHVVRFMLRGLAARSS